MNLYQLTAGYQQVLDLIEESNGDFIDTLESLTDAIEVKAENTAKAHQRAV